MQKPQDSEAKDYRILEDHEVLQDGDQFTIDNNKWSWSKVQPSMMNQQVIERKNIVGDIVLYRRRIDKNTDTTSQNQQYRILNDDEVLRDGDKFALHGVNDGCVWNSTNANIWGHTVKDRKKENPSLPHLTFGRPVEGYRMLGPEELVQEGDEFSWNDISDTWNRIGNPRWFGRTVAVNRKLSGLNCNVRRPNPKPPTGLGLDKDHYIEICVGEYGPISQLIQESAFKLGYKWYFGPDTPTRHNGDYLHFWPKTKFITSDIVASHGTKCIHSFHAHDFADFIKAISKKYDFLPDIKIGEYVVKFFDHSSKGIDVGCQHITKQQVDQIHQRLNSLPFDQN